MMGVPLDKFITKTIRAAFEAKNNHNFLSSQVEFDLAIAVVMKDGKTEVHVIDSQSFPNANRIKFRLEVGGL